MILTPILDKVVIEPDRDIGEKKLESGIVLPCTRKEGGTTQGIVLAKGPDVWSPLIKYGYRVYFDSRFCGTEIRIRGKRKILIMKEEDIIAIEEIT